MIGTDRFIAISTYIRMQAVNSWDNLMWEAQRDLLSLYYLSDADMVHSSTHKTGRRLDFTHEFHQMSLLSWGASGQAPLLGQT